MAGNGLNRVLLIAYHYPPVLVSSGLQRTLSLTQDLPEYGWQPCVLSVNLRAYISTSDNQLRDIPGDTEVVRAFALDTARHLSIRGRYPKLLALPDRWVSWWFGGFYSGLRLIRRHKPAVIVSTYPMATAHLIGLTLHRLTGLPWVADFRDSMTDESYPVPGLQRKVFQWLERKIVTHCNRAVFTAPSALEMYKARYPEVPEERWILVQNGYSEDIFSDVEQNLSRDRRSEPPGPVKLVHSGVVYPSERDPRPLFDALAALKAQGHIDTSKLQIVLRATGHDQLLKSMLEQRGITDVVELAPAVGYRAALAEMLSTDGLLLLQAANCNHQIPAKAYEYLRACRPVLALTDDAGDTAAMLRGAGIDTIAPLDDAEAIAEELKRFIALVEDGEAPLATSEAIKRGSRQLAAQRFAEQFDQLVSGSN